MALSTSIPTETFNVNVSTLELFTIRMDSDSVDVSLNGIDVSLRTNQSSVDVIMVGISTNSTRNQQFDGDDDDCLSREGTLDGDEVSVTILNTSSGTQIEIVFDDVDPDQVGVACVWRNESSQTWETSGCRTRYSADERQIVCSCDHLTTFGTIRGLQNKCKSLLVGLDDDAFVVLNSVFACLFAAIVVWVLFHALRLSFAATGWSALKTTLQI